ncbi:L-lactate dehydrogenase [Loigolactobacillus backii]|uniref:L-lactate dehydrogenase n=1 Tax=Loigolactobacillus backii TaxID=375175 RepID=A0A192GYJ5_9LACO|nr:L-lactate dehydrogenase [Loigolactobacillus backii]ANK60832.1 L-lactate dehydrogenase [Loigolactobacillus backii]ANK61594.1 L-lactate dehydrogenase [Loigolactobacillus backii]ANK65785.1 L-lactate dehydrogenase [Loigolactobacillus backii]ANK68262.1 L-lactate dehydrogenase [Loigolactobacillus backii]ANK69208.1 L-lactate dehydrogenase [Loigolactobacillus backii]
MRKMAVIGLGHVGREVGYTIVTKGIADDLTLFDKSDKIAKAEQLDLQDAQGQLTTHTNVAIQDYAQLQDTDVIIFSAGDITALYDHAGDRLAELRVTSKIVEEVGPKIKASGFNGIIIDITNPCDVITTYLQDLTGLPKKQVFGTGTSLDTLRMKRAVGEKLNVELTNVAGFNLGEHGETQFTAWSTVTVGGKPISVLAKERNLDVNQLSEDARLGGWYIFNGKRYTSYGIATAAVTLAEAVFSDARVIRPVSNWNEELGICIGQPAIVGREGIVATYPITLPADEQALFQKSADTIKHNYSTLPSKS